MGLNLNNTVEFLSEVEEVINGLNRQVIALQAAYQANQLNPELINNLFRSAHTLKGLAGMGNLTILAKLAHDLEELLDDLRLDKRVVDAELLKLLYNAVEQFLWLLKNLEIAGGGPELVLSEIKPELALLFKQLAEAKSLSQTKAEGGGAKLTPTREAEILNYLPLELRELLSDYEKHRLLTALATKPYLFMLTVVFKLADFDVALNKLTETLGALSNIEILAKLPSSNVVGEHELAFAILLASSEATLNLPLADFPGSSLERLDKDDTPDTLNKAAEPLVAMATLQSAPQTLSSPAAIGEQFNKAPTSHMVRVDIRRLDKLMSNAAELATSQKEFEQIIQKMPLEKALLEPALQLRKELANFNYRLQELQRSIMDVRMVPLVTLFESMVRLGYQIAGELGKEVNISLVGEYTELDKLIVEDLHDILLHLLRNALDHGLEPGEERIKAGKERVGKIVLEAFTRGRHVVIQVKDDGRGIDLRQILKVAAERQLLPPNFLEQQKLDEVVQQGSLDSLEIADKVAILNLLFLPGFSTRAEVSNYSGRGVGLDVVKTGINKLSGFIEIASEFGQGTSISLVLPITLAIIPSLIVSVQGSLYAVPLHTILESVPLKNYPTKFIGKQEMLLLDDRTLPLVSLAQIFKRENLGSLTFTSKIEEKGGPLAPSLESEKFVLIVGGRTSQIGVLVDGLVGKHDIVLKSLGERFKNLMGIAGAADFGKQKTILVIDMLQLLEHFE